MPVELFFTSRNTGPNLGNRPDPMHLTYVGPYLEQAIASVAGMIDYEKREFPEDRNRYSALPSDTQREWVKFYYSGGWWCSIEKIVLQTNEQKYSGSTTVF